MRPDGRKRSGPTRASAVRKTAHLLCAREGNYVKYLRTSTAQTMARPLCALVKLRGNPTTQRPTVQKRAMIILAWDKQRGADYLPRL